MSTQLSLREGQTLSSPPASGVSWCNTVSYDIALVNIGNYLKVHKIFRLRLWVLTEHMQCWWQNVPSTPKKKKRNVLIWQSSVEGQQHVHLHPLSDIWPVLHHHWLITDIKYEAWRKARLNQTQVETKQNNYTTIEKTRTISAIPRFIFLQNIILWCKVSDNCLGTEPIEENKSFS